LRSDRNMQTFFSGTLVRGAVSTMLILFMSLLFIPAVSAAPTVTGDSRTYVQSRETADGSKILGGYEYLDFVIQNIGNETISFHTGGWMHYDFRDDELGRKSPSDLQYSYLSFKSKTANTTVNLGRVMVFEGVAAERVDGAYARTDLMGGFGISAFGGMPVETNIDEPGNNVIYGGRLYHELGDVYRIGLSALKEEKNSLRFREEGGIDIWVHPMSNVNITGRSSYNDITQGWMEHSYSLMLGPFARLRLDTTAQWINYDDYFYAVTTSALSVFNGLLLDDERARILGEEASYGITDTLSVAADYKNFDYELAGHANYYGGKLKFSVAESGGAGIGYHRMEGYTDTLKYNEYRVYGYKKFGKFDVTADVIDVSYVRPINSVKDAYSLSVGAQYALTEAWKIGADVEYSHNPDFEHDTRTFLKLLYHFGPKGGA
jgi:hypothetical protein